MSIKVNTPVAGFTGFSVGVLFVDGVAEVDELTPAQEQYFGGAGYGLPDELAGPPAFEIPTSVSATSTKAQLVAYAAAKGVIVNEAGSNAEILLAIRTTEAGQPPTQA